MSAVGANAYDSWSAVIQTLWRLTLRILAPCGPMPSLLPFSLDEMEGSVEAKEVAEQVKEISWITTIRLRAIFIPSWEPIHAIVRLPREEASD